MSPSLDKADSIRTFVASLPHSAFLPHSTEYQTAAEYWSNTVSLNPSCFFIPKSAAELARGLQNLVKQKISFSVKGGGHNTNRGWASTDEGGVVISTAALKGLELIENAGQAGPLLRVGIGVSLTEIYDYLHGRSITIVAGNQATPGLGGLFLGGGAGPYWNRHGYAVNTIVNFQVVAANGEILEVNADAHPDLFWALKGGLCNFGIVTRLDFRTFPTENIYAGAYIISPESHNAAFDAFSAFTATEGDNPNAQAILMSPAKGALMTSLFYDGPHDSDEPPHVFKELSAVPRINSTFKRTDWNGIVKFSFLIGPYGFRRYISTITVRKDTKLLQRLFDTYQSSASENLADVDGGSFQISASVMTVASFGKNQNGPWGIKDSKEDLITLMQISTWKTAKDDERVMRWTEEITEEIKRVAKNEGKLHKCVLINNANETQDAFAGYEHESLERMQEVSKKYDPDGVFQKLRSGGPKLWK